ncbi:MAG: M15 family metallopeptidase [Bacteroidetes bacterium]|jgi:D-alanyl-D-alanine dipeptidase|nr:M15 family metallopeptidase [Bacteroidota bacterium]
MNGSLFHLACFLFVASSPVTAQIEEPLVNLREVVPDIVLDLRYAGTDNFLHQKLYTVPECYVALSAARRLAVVQDSLRPRGLGLKVYDAYRPRSVQFLMWEILPNATYVANPVSGSAHNRGGAVDVSLVDLVTGVELAMPTAFDHFGPEAWLDYAGLPAPVIANRELLRTMMENVGGFQSYQAEWWHYSLQSANVFPLLDFQLR